MLSLSPNGKKSFEASVLFQVCITFMIGGVPAVAPLVVQSLGVHDSATGVFLGICYLGTALMSLLSGAMIRRFGPVRMSQLGCILGAAGVLGCMAPSLLVVALSGFVLGLADGPIMPAASDLITHNAERDKWSFALSVKQASAPVGTALAGFLLPWIATEFSWKWALFLCAAAGIGVALYAERYEKLFDNHDEPAARVSFAATREALAMVWGSSLLRPLAVTSFIYEGMQVCLLGFLVIAMNMQRGFSLVAAGYILAALNVGAIVGRILFGFLDSKFNRAHAMISLIGAAMGLMVCVLISMKAGDDMLLVLSAAFATGMIALGWKGVFLSVVAKNAPDGRVSEATGGVDFISFAGAIFMPVVLGAADFVTGSYVASFALVSFCCAAAGLWLLLQKKPHNPQGNA
jgi:sugar phosphate permease